MAKFNPSVLVPASQVEGFNNPGNQRTTQQVALDNIDRMKAQWAAGDKAEGKKNFKVVGDRVAFTVRVNNTALVLETTEVAGTKVEVREMTAPKGAFPDALDYYAERFRAGHYADQLSTLGDKREARTTKMRATRSAKKADKKDEAKPA